MSGENSHFLSLQQQLEPRCWSPPSPPPFLSKIRWLEMAATQKKRKTNEKLCETIGYTPSALDTVRGAARKIYFQRKFEEGKKRSFRCLPSMGIKLIRLLKLIAARRRSRIRQKVHFNWIPNLGKLNWTRPSAWKTGLTWTDLEERFT